MLWRMKVWNECILREDFEGEFLLRYLGYSSTGRTTFWSCPCCYTVLFLYVFLSPLFSLQGSSHWLKPNLSQYGLIITHYELCSRDITLWNIRDQDSNLCVGGTQFNLFCISPSYLSWIIGSETSLNTSNSHSSLMSDPALYHSQCPIFKNQMFQQIYSTKVSALILVH